MVNYKKIINKHSINAIKDCLTHVSNFGFSEDEHFYIVFRTNVNGVLMPKVLSEKFPDEMIIVLQHQFESLIVNPSNFEVTLSFDGAKERLAIPYTAIIGFYDPGSDFNIDLGESNHAMVYRCLKSENDDEASEYFHNIMYGENKSSEKAMSSLNMNSSDIESEEGDDSDVTDSVGSGKKEHDNVIDLADYINREKTED